MPRRTPVDEDAGFGAQTQNHPRNIEEARTAASRAETAAPSNEPCAACAPLKAMPDPKHIHACARCRSELLPEVAERRARQRAAEAMKRKAAGPA